MTTLMHREVLKHANLLKKYSSQLIYDYTEYPTKGIWSESFDHNSYLTALSEWVPNQEPTLLYVHTPFCEELCYFCLCSKSITKDYGKVKSYLEDYLLKEISMLSCLIQSKGTRLNVKEIYLGGGSPTYYNEEDFVKLCNSLRSLVDFSSIETFTIEVDPRRVDERKLLFYSSQGVNRLSFGVQDFSLEVQKEINRIQPAELFDSLLTDSVRSAFKTINFDILVGLPKQTPGSMRDTISRVRDLRPTEVQPLYVHYKPGTRSYMTRMVRNVQMPDYFDRKAIYAEVIDGLLEAGYIRAGYENFALPTDVLAGALTSGNATYNSLGTTAGVNTNFVSLGASAHGVFGDYYFQNFYELDKYGDHLSRNLFPIYRGLKLSRDDMIRRDVIKHFRIYDSLDKAHFSKKWDIEFDNYFSSEFELISEFQSDGLVQSDSRSLTLTGLGREFTPRFCEVFDRYLSRMPFDKAVHVDLSQLRRKSSNGALT